MRILVAHPGPQFSVQDVFDGWTGALRAAGAHVIEFNLDDRLCFYGRVLLPVPDQPGVFRRAIPTDQVTELAVNGLYAALYKTRPDVLLVISGFLIPSELLDLARLNGTRVVLLHTESPYEDTRQVRLAAHADLNLINDPTNLESFRALAPTFYCPHAYRPGVHHPGPADPALVCDLGFVGTGYPSRVEFFAAMDLAGLDVVLAGNWQLLTEAHPLRGMLAHAADECCDNADAVRLYRSARSGINLYRREAQAEHLATGWAMGPREVEMAATGLFFLREPRGEGDRVLGMLPTFTSPGEASEQLRWWLAHPTHRAAAAAAARAAVAERTFDRHAAQLLRLLDGKLIHEG